MSISFFSVSEDDIFGGKSRKKKTSPLKKVYVHFVGKTGEF